MVKAKDLDQIQQTITDLREALRQREALANGRLKVHHPAFGKGEIEVLVPQDKIAELDTRISSLTAKLKAQLNTLSNQLG